MPDGAISYNSASEAVAKAERTQIKKLEHDETVTIKRTANHNEVSIMESEWSQIKRKINAISLKKKFDISSIIVGAIIPYTIDIVADYSNNVTPNYLPLAICAVLFVLAQYLPKVVPFLGENNSAENQVHLNDLKDMIERVEASSQKKGQ